MTFADLGLSDQLLRAVEESGYSEPTPIQRGAIPSVLMGRDLLQWGEAGPDYQKLIRRPFRWTVFS